MKRRVSITLILGILIVTVATVYLYLSFHHKVSSIYRHYAKVAGIKASFVPSYAINDSVFVDVTLLQATNTATWAILKHDFQIRELPFALMQHLQQGSDIVCTQTSPFSQGHELVAISYKTMEITIFHTENRQQEYAILHHNIKKRSF